MDKAVLIKKLNKVFKDANKDCMKYLKVWMKYRSFDPTTYRLHVHVDPNIMSAFPAKVRSLLEKEAPELDKLIGEILVHDKVIDPFYRNAKNIEGIYVYKAPHLRWN